MFNVENTAKKVINIKAYGSTLNALKKAKEYFDKFMHIIPYDKSYGFEFQSSNIVNNEGIWEMDIKLTTYLVDEYLINVAVKKFCRIVMIDNLFGGNVNSLRYNSYVREKKF